MPELPRRQARTSRSGCALPLLSLLAILLVVFGIFLLLHHRPAGPHRVTLTWQRAIDSTTARVVSYNVYRSTSRGGPYAKLASGVKAFRFEDELVNPGTTYYYVVKSVDESGRESQPSEEVQAVVPAP